MMISESLTKAFEEQAARPPKNDVYIGAFYTRLLDELNNNTPTATLLSQISKDRGIPDAYLVNLTFRVAQFRSLSGDVPDSTINEEYPEGLDVPNNWSLFFEALNSRSDFREIIEDDLRHRETVTTKFERYQSLKSSIGMVSKVRNSVDVADFGCSKNLGLRGVRSGRPFKTTQDITPNFLFTSHQTLPIRTGNWIGIDKMDPRAEDFDPWFKACAYYPTEIRRNGLNGNGFLDHVEGVAFARHDLLEPETLRDSYPNGFHIIHIATLAYQFTPEQRQLVLSTAKELTQQKNGILLVQDFAIKKQTEAIGLEFITDWGREDSYRTFVYASSEEMPLEWLVWDSGRCARVSAGEDFFTVNALLRG